MFVDAIMSVRNVIAVGVMAVVAQTYVTVVRILAGVFSIGKYR